MSGADAAAASGGGRFARLDALFRGAVARPAGERLDWLRSSERDEALVAEVEALLREDAGGVDLEGAVSRLVAEAGPAPGALLAAAQAARPEVPGFAIIRLLGRGGMGEVYEAEQATPRRRVALKVIRPEAVTPALLRRFELEGEFLARLDHPGIATIFETGTAGEGEGRRPYLAMELVEGVPLVEYAAGAGLGLPQRLALFCEVCDAVQHAHQRGVIHRDLKPANILVRGDGRVRVVDFGVARAAGGSGQDLATLAAQTQDGQIIGTLSFMSPEQVRGDAVVDTRADVYALGVVLFELLTERLPHGAGEGSLFAMLRAIAESPAPRASSLDPRLRGDLDAIIARALEKDPARRYGSVADLGSDVRRHLRREPILARPPSTAYHLGRFVARNRGIVAAGAGALAVLLGALGAVTGALAEAARQGRLAERRAEVLAGVNAFLAEDVIAATDPWQGGKTDVTLVAALDAAAPRIKDRFGADAATEAAVRESLGRAYLNLSLLDKAATQIAQAHELSRGLGDPGVLADRANLLATLQIDTGRYDEAVATLEVTLGLLGERLPRDRERRNTTLAWLANAYGKLRRDEDSARIYAELVADARRHAPESIETIHLVASLAIIYQQLGRHADAEPLTIEAVERSAAAIGEEHPDTLTAMNNLGTLYYNLGRHAESEATYVRVLEARRRILGDDHRHTATTRAVLARVYIVTGRFEEAEPLVLTALAQLAAKLGDDHAYTQITRSIAATMYERWGRPEEAARYRGDGDAGR